MKDLRGGYIGFKFAYFDNCFLLQDLDNVVWTSGDQLIEIHSFTQQQSAKLSVIRITEVSPQILFTVHLAFLESRVHGGI